MTNRREFLAGILPAALIPILSTKPEPFTIEARIVGYGKLPYERIHLEPGTIADPDGRFIPEFDVGACGKTTGEVIQNIERKIQHCCNLLDTLESDSFKPTHKLLFVRPDFLVFETPKIHEYIGSTQIAVCSYNKEVFRYLKNYPIVTNVAEGHKNIIVSMPMKYVRDGRWDILARMCEVAEYEGKATHEEMKSAIDLVLAPYVDNRTDEDWKKRFANAIKSLYNPDFPRMGFIRTELGQVRFEPCYEENNA